MVVALSPRRFKGRSFGLSKLASRSIEWSVGGLAAWSGVGNIPLEQMAAATPARMAVCAATVDDVFCSDL